MSLIASISDYWRRLQGCLFPEMAETIGPLGERHERFIAVLGLISIEAFLAYPHGMVGRPPAERVALARAFLAKAIFNFPTTRILLDWLAGDRALRRLCGWEKARDVPSEATFSRAFAEFAESGLPARIHEALIAATYRDRMVGHISRDSTAIEGREKPESRSKTEAATLAPEPTTLERAADRQQKAPSPPEPAVLPKTAVAPGNEDVVAAGSSVAAPAKRKRGRPRKHPAPETEASPPDRRLVRQGSMTLCEMLADLPKDCDVGAKRNAKGHSEHWTGYKLHLDVADGDISVSFILTSASLHDSQAAIPLMTLTSDRVVYFYDLMDSAYDALQIYDASRKLNHVPIIERNPRRDAELRQQIADDEKARKRLSFPMPEELRYNQRSSAERFNGNIKDNCGARSIRVRGHAKVLCHLGFGILGIAATQIIRMLTPPEAAAPA